MSVLLRTFCRFRSALDFSALAALLAVAGVAQPAVAQGTHLWVQSQIEEFEKGTPQGVALQSDGPLRQGPGLTELLTTPSTFVWSVAADKSGVVYVGTGSPATVLRAPQTQGERPLTLFESKDVSVQVVRLGPDGALYAATLPSGKVYRLKAGGVRQNEASATLVFDAAQVSGTEGGKTGSDSAGAKPRYIWDLTFDPAGRLYIATGNPAAVYRVDPSRPNTKPELFFQCDEAHIRSLAWDAKGNLIAGSDGSGLVYRISPEGKGYVLFERSEERRVGKEC
jgi:glucose/arabinose dehydrogenase